jgi:formylglycine-generating enzyme required for sulfatase activity
MALDDNRTPIPGGEHNALRAQSRAEQALKPRESFRECVRTQGKDYCPEMIVIPAGSFMMGSPPTEKNRLGKEGPQHPVTIVKPFAVSKLELTFDEWDTCVAYGDCPSGVSDAGFGRGQRPLINVSFDDARRYELGSRR